MNDELGKAWKETVVAYFKEESRHLPGDADKMQVALIQNNVLLTSGPVTCSSKRTAMRPKSGT
jgi:hypothetical protein